MFLKHLLNTYSLSYRTDKEGIVVFFIDQSENIKAPILYNGTPERSLQCSSSDFSLKVLKNAELKAWKALQVSIEYIKLQLLLHVIMKSLALYGHAKNLALYVQWLGLYIDHGYRA